MQAIDIIRVGERTGEVVGITLYYGYLNNLQNALPVLQRHGFSATCYVVSGQLDQWRRECPSVRRN